MGDDKIYEVYLKEQKALNRFAHTFVLCMCCWLVHVGIAL